MHSQSCSNLTRIYASIAIHYSEQNDQESSLQYLIRAYEKSKEGESLAVIISLLHYNIYVMTGSIYSSINFVVIKALLWSPYRIGQTIIFSSCGFFLSSIYLLFFPRLISVAAHWLSTILWHMMWPQCKFRMQVWNVVQAARWKYRMQKWCKKSPSEHHCTT